MSLYTDRDFVTLADMLALDSEVAEVASSEAITVKGAGGIIREARSECADKIMASQQAFASGQRLCATGQVVMSDPLRRWMLYRALVMFYRAARNRRISDRYEAKHDFYRFDERRQWLTFWSAGLPVVWQPLPAPGAVYEFNAGTWTAANVSAVAGGAQVGTVTYDVAITWTDSSRYVSATQKGNAESGPSAVVSITVPPNNVIQVSIAGLVPPDGVFRGNQAAGTYGPLRATHWNLYVGVQGGTLYLQTGSPVGTPSYTAAPVLSGNALESGQSADVNLPFQAVLNRA